MSYDNDGSILNNIITQRTAERDHWKAEFDKMRTVAVDRLNEVMEARMLFRKAIHETVTPLLIERIEMWLNQTDPNKPKDEQNDN